MLAISHNGASTDPGGKVYAYRNDRLGARLVSMFNALRLARRFDVPFRLRWDTATDLDGFIMPAGDFFTADFLRDHQAGDEEWAEATSKAIGLYYSGITDSEFVSGHLQTGGLVWVATCFSSFSLKGELSKDVEADLSQLWETFQFRADLGAARSKVLESVPANSVAFHIRRGDILHDQTTSQKPWPGKYAIDEFYEAQLDLTITSGRAAILFSDDAPTLNRFLKTFPAATPAAQFVEEQGFTSPQVDFLELCVMSACSEVIAPAESAFSIAATVLGGGTRRKVAETLPPIARDIAAKKAIRRLRKTDATDIPGKLGQDLNWLIDYLVKSERSVEAAAILEEHLKAGLDISFLYPLAIALNISSGKIDVAVELGQLAQARIPTVREDLGASLAMLALAHACCGQNSESRRVFEPVLWSMPDLPTVQFVLTALYDLKVLDGASFLPLDLGSNAQCSSGIVVDAIFEAAVSSVSCDTRSPSSVIYFLDWGLLFKTDDWLEEFRGLPLFRPLNQRFKTEVSRVATGRGPSALRAKAVQLVVAARQGDENAIDGFDALIAQAPDDPLLHHRQAVAAMSLSRSDLAMSASDHAVRVASDSTPYRAWRGLQRIAIGDAEAGLADLRYVLDAGVQLPGLFLVFANALQRVGETDEAEALLHAVQRLAPWDARAALPAISLAMEAGNPVAARKMIATLLRSSPTDEEVRRFQEMLGLQAAY